MSDRVEKEINKLVDEIGYDEISELFKTLKGGKRLRARLVQKITEERKDAPLLGAIIELIHAASLLHDDVIDDASLRRGVPSVNATQGSKTAIMVGDVLYSKAFSSLVAFERAIAQSAADAVTALSLGEMMDVRMSENFNEDEARYMQMLYLKTASLIEASAQSAAILVGKDPKAYALYGKNLGLAFQIIVDILDIVSDEKTLGKPAMNDFVEGKCTLPYIYLYEALKDDEKVKLISFHGKPLENEETAWITSKIEEHKTIERAYMVARKLSDEAVTALDDEPELVAIIETMMERSY